MQTKHDEISHRSDRCYARFVGKNANFANRLADADFRLPSSEAAFGKHPDTGQDIPFANYAAARVNSELVDELAETVFAL